MLATLPNFLMYFISAIVIYTVAISLYVKITPYNEIALIKSGNTASAVSFAGTMLGFSIVFYNVIVYSHSILEILIWGSIGLVIQLAAWATVNYVFGNLNKAIVEERCMADAVMLGCSSVVVGIIQAACMTPS